MRSFVVEPMQAGRLFLAGDAADIVPPWVKDGIRDRRCVVLAGTRRILSLRQDRYLLDGYTQKCLSRVWKAQRFSWWMTSMLHLNSHRQPLRPKAAIRRARLRHDFRGGVEVAGGKLHGAADRLAREKIDQ